MVRRVPLLYQNSCCVRQEQIVLFSNARRNQLRCMLNVITICNALIDDKGLQVNWQRNLRANRRWLLLIKRFPDKSKSKLIRKKLSYSYLIITEHWLNSWRRNYKSINDLLERLILLLFLLEWKQLQLFIIIITGCTKFTTNLSQLS